MNIVDTLLSLYIRAVTLPAAVLGRRKRNILLATLAQRIAPHVVVPVPDGRLTFFCPGVLPEFRARTLLTKEPETLAWIDAFERDTLFFDVGANVGCFTLYACLRGIRTVSVEPSAYNFFLLNENIRINGFNDLATAYCIALSDRSSIGVLNMSAPEVGGALALFGKEAASIDIAGDNMPVGFRQGAIGYCLDEFARNFPTDGPVHIKIDVDGIEKAILRGAADLLRRENVRSVLVEVDEDKETPSDGIIPMLRDAGFRISFRGNSEMLKGSRMETIVNCIFTRP